jgi:hypothetical protein
VLLEKESHFLLVVCRNFLGVIAYSTTCVEIENSTDIQRLSHISSQAP